MIIVNRPHLQISEASVARQLRTSDVARRSPKHGGGGAGVPLGRAAAAREIGTPELGASIVLTIADGEAKCRARP